MVVAGQIYTDKKNPVKATSNREINCPEADTDCHGVTFADGELWINNDQVQTILDDKYKLVESPQSGDVVIYREPTAGAVVHSMTVVSVDKETGEVIVEGLGGVETQTKQTEVQKGWVDPKANIEYYRKKTNTVDPKETNENPEKKIDNSNEGEKNNKTNKEG